MEYKFVVAQENYEKFAAGRVIYSVPGTAPFPVRLIDEIFQRACALMEKVDSLRLYDPCVGSGYMMTVLGLLHGEKIASMDGSDVDEKVIALAEKNLSLLSETGLKKRIGELEDYIKLYDKDSHRGALEDAKLLLSMVQQRGHEINIQCMVGDIPGREYDIIIADLPYENLTSRIGTKDIQTTVEDWGKTLKSGGVLVVVTDKKQRFQPFSWQESRSAFNHGKRRIWFIKKATGYQLPVASNNAK